MEHFTSQFRIHGLDGNINGLQMVPDDPVYIMITHIGQGHIISLYEGQSGIIIFKIKSISHSRRHLVNKTENAVIGTGTIIIHQILLKGNPKVFFIFLLHLQLPDLSVCLFHFQNNEFFIHQISVVKYIFHRLTVYSISPGTSSSSCAILPSCTIAITCLFCFFTFISIISQMRSVASALFQNLFEKSFFKYILRFRDPNTTSQIVHLWLSIIKPLFLI